MIVLIVAGGSGTRLWPLSVSDYPKHLLTLAGENSLLQNTYERARLVAEPEKIFISTEASHAHHVQEQLHEIPKENILIEPARRGTMPCIISALEVIARKFGADEPIVSIHADHYIRDNRGFAKNLQYAAQISEKTRQIVLLGAEPTQPETKFGYIEKGEQSNGYNFVYDIKTFKEKPDFQTAKKYMESGNYLWNMGYFIAPFSVFKEAITEYADPHWSEQLKKLEDSRSKKEFDEVYLNYQNEPIDTALIEKIPNLLVLPGSFDWLDVGSFDDVHKVSSQDEAGNASFGDNVHLLESEQVYIRNDEDKPVAVIGLDNVAIVNTKNGLLVMRLDQSQKVKDVVQKLKGEDD